MNWMIKSENMRSLTEALAVVMTIQYSEHPVSKHPIHKLRAKIARLEAEIAHDIYEELAILPKQFGFDSVTEFLRAVRKAAGSGKRRRRKKTAKAAKPARRSSAKRSNAPKGRKKRSAPRKVAAPEATPAQMPAESMIPPA